MFLLFKCIKHLGFWQGIRYRRILSWMRRDPEIMKIWAETCDKEAAKIEFFEPDSNVAWMMRDWSKQLMFYYNKNKQNYDPNKKITHG